MAAVFEVVGFNDEAAQSLKSIVDDFGELLDEYLRAKWDRMSAACVQLGIAVLVM